MQQSSPQFERPLLRMGSMTFLAGLAIFIISSLFHASREDPTNHLRVFAEYDIIIPMSSKSMGIDPAWVAQHLGLW